MICRKHPTRPCGAFAPLREIDAGVPFQLKSRVIPAQGHLRKPIFFAPLVILRILFPSVGAAASGDRSRLATAPTGFPEVPASVAASTSAQAPRDAVHREPASRCAARSGRSYNGRKLGWGSAASARQYSAYQSPISLMIRAIGISPVQESYSITGVILDSSSATRARIFGKCVCKIPVQSVSWSSQSNQRGGAKDSAN